MKLYSSVEEVVTLCLEQNMVAVMFIPPDLPSPLMAIFVQSMVISAKKRLC